MDYSLIQSLVENAYFKFKQEFPEEEPFFRITCTRKFGRSERRNWRGNRDDSYLVRTVDKHGRSSFEDHKPTPIVLNESVKLKNDDKIAQRNSENRWCSSSRTLPIQRVKVKDADKKTILTTKFTYDAMVDVRFDDPVTVSTIRYFMDTTNKVIKELHEGYKVFLEDPLFKCGSEMIYFGDVRDTTVDQRIEDAINTIKKSKINQPNLEKKINTIECLTQTEAFTCLDCDDVVKELKETFKTTLTIRDLAEKYVVTQKKLNDLKSVAMPIMRSYKSLPINDMISKDGFIKTISFFIDFVDKENDKNDLDYDSQSEID